MWKWVKEKLHLTSWQDVIHIIVIEIVINFLWWVATEVFNAIPDIIKGIGFLVVFVAGMFCVALYLPKLSPQYIGKKNNLNVYQVRRKPSRLEHDSVLWEDIGRRYWGGDISVIGPLCPKDFVFLGTEYRDIIENRASDNTTISDSSYHSRLFCPECKSKYTFGTQPKTIQKSRDEVRNRFEGKRRRDQET